MNTSNNVVIKKATVSVEYNGKTEGHELQKLVNDWWDKILAPAIEAMVGNVDDNIFVHIPEAAFDISVNSAEDWQQAACRQVLAGLEQEISSGKMKAAQGNMPGLLRRNEGTFKKTPSQRFLDEWLFFLKMGFMPWWGNATNAREWAAALKDYIQHTAVAADVQELAGHLATPAVIDRLIAQLPGALFWEFIAVFAKWDTAFTGAVRNAENALTKKLNAQVPEKQFLHEFRKSVVTAAAGKHSQKETLALLENTASVATVTTVTAEEIFRNAAAVLPVADRKAEDGTPAAPAAVSGEARVDTTDEHTGAAIDGHMGAAITAEELFAGIDVEDNTLPADQALTKDADQMPANKSGTEATTANATTTQKRPGMETGTDDPEKTQQLSDAGRKAAREANNGRDTGEQGKTAEELWSENTTADTGEEYGDIAAIKTDEVPAGTPVDKPGMTTGDEAAQEKSGTENIPEKSQDTASQPEAISEEQKQNKPQRPSKADNIRRDQLKKEMYEAAAEGIYIQNAGIVIVAVYLVSFFRNMELAADDRITDMPRAIALLHYLATGNETFAEFEIVLAKILCGIEPDEYVDTSYSLTEEDKAEADQLLLAVIDNWTALKQTSPEGLRGTFLVRDGRLTRENGSWKLYVQEQSFDILVDMLPWNIGMIYLPWMPSLLHVNWRS